MYGMLPMTEASSLEEIFLKCRTIRISRLSVVELQQFYSTLQNTETMTISVSLAAGSHQMHCINLLFTQTMSNGLLANL
jgi:imidazoleglycerol phosphate dehydratase HisB